MIVRCDCELAHLQPDFRADVVALLEGSPYGWAVISGYRSLEAQLALWQDYRFGKRDKYGLRDPSNPGARAAPPGKSAHNFGLAIDVVLDGDPATPGVQPSWDTKLAGWLWLKATCTKHPRLKSGWSFGDWPHIERFRWQRYIDVTHPTT